MDMEQELLREHSKVQALKIASWIGTNTNRLDMLLRLFLHGEPIVTQRAAWIVGIVGERHSELLSPYLKKMILKMREPGVHNAVKRNTVKVLQTIDIPRGLLGTVATVCFDFLASPNEPIAVKVFSMTVLARIARQEPDLMNELRLIVAQQLPTAGPGFRARARAVLHLPRNEE